MGVFDKYNSGLPFMQGREKRSIKDLYGVHVSVDEHGYLTGENGEFAVFTVAGDDTSFFFANAIVTDLFKTIDADGLDIRKADIVFSSKMSKKWGTEYTTFTIS